MTLIGYEIVRTAAIGALARAGMLIADVKLVELWDCFSTNEILLIDALGLSPPGKAHEYVSRRPHHIWQPWS